MKIKSLSSCLMVVLLAFFSAARAQSTQVWDGGDGTWDVNNTPDWDSGNVWKNGNGAYFGAGGGTVSVSDQGGTAPVTLDHIEFSDTSSSDTYTFNGSSLATENNDTDVTVDGNNAAAITFNNEFIINATPNAYFGNDQSNFVNGSTATVTYGAMDFENGNNVSRTGVQILALNQVAGGKTVINGNITTGTLPSGLTPTLWFNLFGQGGGTYQVNGSLASGIAIQDNIGSTLLLNTSSFGSANINVIGLNYGLATSILTVGSQTISNSIGTQNDTLLYIGGSTAGDSSFNGSINPFAELYLTAAANGRVNFNTSISGYSEGGLNTTGGGTVVLNNVSGNSYGTYLLSNYGDPGTVAATLGARNTIINNTSGDAFGNTSANTVNLLANAGLGGKGSTTKSVVAADTSSVIAPGDGNIATLTLGSLTAVNGLTMNFKLTGEGFNGFSNIAVAGTDDDLLYLGPLSLGGTVDINLTAMDALQTGEIYYLAEGSGSWTEAPGTTFAVTTPAGYALDMTYGTNGVFFDSSDDALSIELVETPEPSTYALMGLGLLALVGIGRWMRRCAV